MFDFLMYYMEENDGFKLKRFLIQDGRIYKMGDNDTPATVDKSDDYAEKFKHVLITIHLY